MITVYTKPNCSHCVTAKQYLVEHGIGFAEVDVVANANALSFLREQGHRTVPQLYVGERLIEGGNAALQRLSISDLHQMIDSSSGLGND